MTWKCNRELGELGSGISRKCEGEYILLWEKYDDTKSVLTAKSQCNCCGHVRQGVVWQK